MFNAFYSSRFFEVQRKVRQWSESDRSRAKRVNGPAKRLTDISFLQVVHCIPAQPVSTAAHDAEREITELHANRA